MKQVSSKYLLSENCHEVFITELVKSLKKEGNEVRLFCKVEMMIFLLVKSSWSTIDVDKPYFKAEMTRSTVTINALLRILHM